jgi:hypothetical protein
VTVTCSVTLSEMMVQVIMEVLSHRTLNEVSIDSFGAFVHGLFNIDSEMKMRSDRFWYL